MRHARAKQVAFVVQKNLGFINQAPKCGGVNDAVAVALVRVAHAGGVGGQGGFSVATAKGLIRVTGVGRKWRHWPQLIGRNTRQ